MMQRLLLVCAGLIGGAGVLAAAAASHAEEARNLGAIATIFLAHGPAMLALALSGRRGLLAAGLVMALGTALFGADLAARQWLGHGVFPGAAPIGGGAMVLGWLAIAGVALARHARN